MSALIILRQWGPHSCEAASSGQTTARALRRLQLLTRPWPTNSGRGKTRSGGDYLSASRAKGRATKSSEWLRLENIAHWVKTLLLSSFVPVFNTAVHAQLLSPMCRATRKIPWALFAPSSRSLTLDSHSPGLERWKSTLLSHSSPRVRRDSCSASLVPSL